MYDYFQKNNFLAQELMIPFNEAMCYGSTSSDIFSNDFSEIRSKVHQVAIEEYEYITLKPLQALFEEMFTRIVLWFDTDMFCQINLLTILAWLDQTNYKGTIELQIVGDQYKPVAWFAIEADGYYAIYEQVLIQKTIQKYVHLDPLRKGIELYLNYLNKESDLMLYIQKHIDVSDNELVPELLEKFKHYGLGDSQYFKIIQNYRENHL